MSESFYILDGTVRIFDGSRWIDAVQGDYFSVPPGGIHAFSNKSGARAAMLILVAPGAPREAYFEGLDRLGETSKGGAGDVFHRPRQPMHRLRRNQQLAVPLRELGV
ncbi:MAG: cupin domain-containing protein [Acidimicrobiia bacterium]